MSRRSRSDGNISVVAIRTRRPAVMDQSMRKMLGLSSARSYMLSLPHRLFRRRHF